jgi:hypothetical protein
MSSAEPTLSCNGSNGGNSSLLAAVHAAMQAGVAPMLAQQTKDIQTSIGTRQDKLENRMDGLEREQEALRADLTAQVRQLRGDLTNAPTKPTFLAFVLSVGMIGGVLGAALLWNIGAIPDFRKAKPT